METFDDLISRLDGYEQELAELWNSYNPNDTDLKIELIGLKMHILYYKYIVDCFELINLGMIDFKLARVRHYLTLLTHAISWVSLVVSPPIAPAAFLGSIYLSLKNRRDNKKMIPVLTEEQVDILFDRIDNMENNYLDKTDSVFDRTLLYENGNNLESLSEPERTQREVCVKLMELLKSGKELPLDNETFRDVLRTIIQQSLESESEDLMVLIAESQKAYNDLVDEAIKLNKKDLKLQRINRFL